MVGCWLSLAVAHAADVTEMPPELGVRSYLRYGGTTVNGWLLEDGERVSSRHVLRNDLDLGLEFSPTTGLAATLDLAITPGYTWKYTETRSMVVEPVDGSGSYLAGLPDKPVTVKTTGLTGIWLGVAASPFDEARSVSQHATWRLDLAVRPPSKGKNLWVARNQSRGSAPGGTGLRLATAFSSDRGVGEPFLTAQWVHEARVVVDVVDEAGTTWARGLSLKPADTIDFRSGVALRAYDNTATKSSVDVELWLGAGYRSWEDVASGLYLPHVLDSGRSIAVTSGDSIAATSGLGFEFGINEYVAVRTGTEFTYRTPYRLEHVYQVTTSPDTWQLGWFFTVQGRGTFVPATTGGDLE